MEAVELGRLADVLGVSVPAEQRAWRLTGVSTDTRTLRVGDVFFALSGERFDGASLVAQAFARGARAVVGPAHSPECGPTRALLRVADTREALLRFLALADPDDPWMVCAFGAAEMVSARAAAILGGHARVGFENNLFAAAGRQAASNAELVAETVAAAAALGRRTGSADTMRQALCG